MIPKIGKPLVPESRPIDNDQLARGTPSRKRSYFIRNLAMSERVAALSKKGSPMHPVVDVVKPKDDERRTLLGLELRESSLEDLP